jgi:HK97 family phage prohead protease
MTQKIERRNITHEFRVSSAGEAPRISGYAALFDTPSENLGGWTETIDPHAFDSVMSGNPDVRALWNHNPDNVLGRTTANTLTLTIDSRGLSYVIDPPDTTLANDLMVSMRRKDITGSSFGFICKRDQWTDNQDGTVTRRILEFDEILDVSPVTYPAYSAATSQARSLPASMPAEMRSRFERRSDDEKSKRSLSDAAGIDDIDLDVCECCCAQCTSGAHGICSADPQCTFAVRQMRMRINLLALKR